MTHPAPPEPDATEAIEILQVNEAGEPVGWRGINEPPDFTKPCVDGCLAPGSSVHTHVIRKGFLLIGTRCYVEVDLDMNVQAVGMMRPFAVAS